MTKTHGRNVPDKDAQELSVRDMLSPLFRHRRSVIITFCSVFLLACVVAWMWAAQYYVSTMQVVVEQDRSDPAVTAAQNGTVTAKAITVDQVSSEAALLQGDDMLRSVAASCGLADEKWSPFNIFLPSDPEKRRAMRIEVAAAKLAKKLDVEAEKTSDVIDVKYGKSGSPETPACVLQTLGKLYLQKHLQLQRPAGTSDFFAQEAETYRQALADSELKLADFSRSAGVAAPDILRTDMAGQVATSEAALYQARQTIAADEKRIANIDEQMSSTPARSSTVEASMASNLLMQNLQATLLAGKIKRSELLLKYDPNYPLVKEADQEIAQTEEAITAADKSKFINQTTDRDPTYEFLRENRAKTEADLASERATAAALITSIKGMRNEMVSLDSDAVKQAALLRDTKAAEANYLLYLGKREQERTSDALDQRKIANVAIAVPAVTPLLPAHSPWLVMLLGLIAAAIASVAAAYVAEYLDPSFRTPDEVADILKMPVLASVPRKVA